MNGLILLLVIVAVIAVVALGLLLFIRSRRKGDVLASGAGRKGGQ